MHVIVCVVCVNFGNEILLRREECKTQANLNFSKKGKMVNYHYSTGCKPEIF